MNATRKLTTPLSRGRAIEILEPHGVWAFHRPGLPDVLAAVTLAEDNQLSFWDAMIVRSAVQVGATRLYSEDLNDGQLIAGVRVENPLRRPLVAQS